MDSSVSSYTIVVTEEGNSFPTAGCHILRCSKSQGYHDFQLRLILPGGQEIPIMTRGYEWGGNESAPQPMVNIRNQITDALIKGQRILVLEKIPVAL